MSAQELQDRVIRRVGVEPLEGCYSELLLGLVHTVAPAAGARLTLRESSASPSCPGNEKEINTNH